MVSLLPHLQKWKINSSHLLWKGINQEQKLGLHSAVAIMMTFHADKQTYSCWLLQNVSINCCCRDWLLRTPKFGKLSVTYGTIDSWFRLIDYTVVVAQDDASGNLNLYSIDGPSLLRSSMFLQLTPQELIRLKHQELMQLILQELMDWCFRNWCNKILRNWAMLQEWLLNIDIMLLRCTAKSFLFRHLRSLVL